MPSITEFLARGKVLEARDDLVIFHPLGTNYRLHLETAGQRYAGPLNQPIECVIRLVARKIWTVPSGGLYITPIFGPPRIVQGRVKYVDDRAMVVYAGTALSVELPGAPTAIDLPAGPIESGALVNVTALPGATFELLEPAIER